MLLNLYVKYEDIEKYNNGEEIIATDKSGASVVLKGSRDLTIEVLVDSKEVITREDHVSKGFIIGTFNKFTIKKSI